GHRKAELALVIDEVDDILLTPGEVDIFTDLDIPVGSEQSLATIARSGEPVPRERVTTEIAAGAVFSFEHGVAKIFECGILRVVSVAHLAGDHGGVAVAGIKQELLDLVAADVAKDAAEIATIVEPVRAASPFPVRPHAQGLHHAT